MGRLTTHVLDTARGLPAAGLEIDLFRMGETRGHLGQWVTNDDGRVDAPLLEGDTFVSGTYELVFQVGHYLDQVEGAKKSDRFLGEVVVRFSLDGAQDHYHVPLLVSPFGYSTYRGS